MTVSRNAMPANFFSRARICLATSALVFSGALHAQSAGISGPSGAVLVWGWQTDIDYGIPNAGANLPLGSYRISDICAASGTAGWALETIVNRGEQAAIQAGFPILPSTVESMPGAPRRDDIKEAMREARDGFCNGGNTTRDAYPFVIMYASCRMVMLTNAHALDIQLQGFQEGGRMSMADLASREGAFVSLKRDMGQVEAVLGSGWGSEVSLTNPTPGGALIGYPVTRYDFEYSGGPGTGMSGIMQNAVKVNNSGFAWVSDQVPGFNIVKAFYENLANDIARDDGSLSFFEGLINSLGGLLREGLPLQSVQFTESKVVDPRTAADALKMEGASVMVAYGIQEVEAADDFCTRPFIPEDYTMTDIGQQISDAMSAMNSPEMQQAMQEYQEAMQGMSPEQKQMMEQMGVGDMIGQMMGGAAPGGQPAAGNPRASSAASSSASGSNMPPTADLEGSNMTETVEKHLEALGYDVGEVDGELSLETTIAISTFQAEKGMEVTGSVSPQLLGALSAEVDSRR